MFLTNFQNYIEKEIEIYLKKKVKTECAEFTSERFFEELDNFAGSSFFETDFGYIFLSIDFINFVTVELEKKPCTLLKNVLKKLKNILKMEN